MPEQDLATKVAVLEDRISRLQQDHADMKTELQVQLGTIRGEIQSVRKEMRDDLTGVNEKLSEISGEITKIAVRLAGDEGAKTGLKDGVSFTGKVAWAIFIACGGVIGFVVTAAIKLAGH